MDCPPWYSAAVKDLGLREAPGPANNPRLLKLFAAAGFGWVKDEHTPWCAHRTQCLAGAGRHRRHVAAAEPIGDAFGLVLACEAVWV
jgi:hypothetical protein